METSIKLEASAFLLIVVIFLFHYDKRSRSNLQYRMFSGCLCLSAAAIALDIISAFLINDSSAVPLWINILVNTLYFALMDLCFSSMVGYGFYLMFEHASEHHCLKIAGRVVGVFLLLMLGTVAANLWNGCLFYFEDGVYIRGPLNRVGYYILLIELCLFCMCYLRNRHVVTHAMQRLIRVIPPLVFAMALIQILVHDILLNGTLAALVNVIFFINFQSKRVSQDSLTELPGRMAFFDELKAKHLKGHSVDLIMVRLEHYEAVNRKFGVKKADRMLFDVAKYLDCFSQRYQAFRFGNTSFILMGNHSDDSDVGVAAELLQHRFALPWTADSTGYVIETTIGYMAAEPIESEESRIIDQLEYAVNVARETNIRRPVCFDQSLKDLFARKDYVLEQIRKALDRDNFEVYYQPLFDCASGQYTTAESLLRLFDENGALISPAEFIPLAEKNGLIDEISWMVLRKVSAFLAEHRELPLKTISINMSVQQLEDWKFIQRIQDSLKEYQLTSDQIRIEITERVMMESPNLVSSVMKQLTSCGVKFYLDDFGIGYSNLAGMMSLSFETIKLDASLIEGIEADTQKQETIRLMVQMLHNAGFLVVAEGVETKVQAECVIFLGMDRIQGYYYARPMPGEDLVEFLAEKGNDRRFFIPDDSL